MKFMLDEKEFELSDFSDDFFNEGPNFNYFYVDDSYYNKEVNDFFDSSFDISLLKSKKCYIIYNGNLLFKTSYFIIKLIEKLIKENISFEVVNVLPCYLQDYLGYSYDFNKYNFSDIVFNSYKHFEDCKYCLLNNKCPGGLKKFEKDAYALVEDFDLPDESSLEIKETSLSNFNFDYFLKKYLRKGSRVFIRTNIIKNSSLEKLNNLLKILSEKNNSLNLNLKWVVVKNKNERLNINSSDFSFKFKTDVIGNDILQTYKVNSNYRNFKIDKHLFLSDFMINFDELTFLPSFNSFYNIILNDFFDSEEINFDDSILFPILSKISFNIVYDKSNDKFILFRDS